MPNVPGLTSISNPDGAFGLITQTPPYQNQQTLELITSGGSITEVENTDQSIVVTNGAGPTVALSTNLGLLYNLALSNSAYDEYPYEISAGIFAIDACMQYGADPNALITNVDSTAAIQNAINAAQTFAATAGGVTCLVILRPGYYLTSGEASIYGTGLAISGDYVGILGAAGDKNAGNNGGTIIAYSGIPSGTGTCLGVNLGTGNSLSSITLNNLSFLPVGNALGNAIGFEIYSITDSHITNINLLDGGSGSEGWLVPFAVGCNASGGTHTCQGNEWGWIYWEFGTSTTPPYIGNADNNPGGMFNEWWHDLVCNKTNNPGTDGLTFGACGPITVDRYAGQSTASYPAGVGRHWIVFDYTISQAGGRAGWPQDIRFTGLQLNTYDGTWIAKNITSTLGIPISTASNGALGLSANGNSYPNVAHGVFLENFDTSRGNVPAPPAGVNSGCPNFYCPFVSYPGKSGFTQIPQPTQPTGSATTYTYTNLCVYPTVLWVQGVAGLGITVTIDGLTITTNLGSGVHAIGPIQPTSVVVLSAATTLNAVTVVEQFADMPS